jgi:sugar phosphate permease
MRHIIPFIFICYVVNYLDRINVGFAALQMNKDLGLTSSIFGLGAGLFFIGYFICEMPSNLALQRFGARRWIARIVITWGLISTLTSLVAGALGFSAARLLLGMAEAGFTPGCVSALHLLGSPAPGGRGRRRRFWLAFPSPT